jgi:hypothetical protein
LVRATARAAEAELARRVAAADATAVRIYGCSARNGAVLVSPGGRVLGASADLRVGDLDERRMVLEPIGDAGHVIVRLVDRTITDEGVVRLTALGRDNAGLDIDGRGLQLRRRHSEILVALALAGPSGLSGGRLAVELAETDVARVTLRAEMSRLRARLGSGLLDSQPYRLSRRLSADFQIVGDLVSEGRIRDAVARYAGPLLPSSEAPVVVEARVRLERRLRGGVLASGDVAVLRDWLGTAWGAEDGAVWRRLADLLPGGSAERAAAAAQARELAAA